MRGDWNIIWEVGGIFKKLILEEERLFGTPEYFKIMVKNVRTNDVHRIDRGVVANNIINQATNSKTVKTQLQFPEKCPR